MTSTESGPWITPRRHIGKLGLGIKGLRRGATSAMLNAVVDSNSEQSTANKNSCPSKLWLCAGYELSGNSPSSEWAERWGSIR